MEIVDSIKIETKPGISSYAGPRGSGKSYQLSPNPGLLVDLASFTQEELFAVEPFFIGVLQRLLKPDPSFADQIEAFSSEVSADNASPTFVARLADPSIRAFLGRHHVVFDSLETLIRMQAKDLGVTRQKQPSLGFDATEIFAVLETLAKIAPVICLSRFSLATLWERMKAGSQLGARMPGFPELLKNTPTRLIADWNAARIQGLLTSAEPQADAAAAREIERLTGGTLEFVVPFTKELSQPAADRSRDDAIGLLANKLPASDWLLQDELKACRDDAELWSLYDEVLACQRRIEPNLDNWQHARLLAAGLVTVRVDERGAVLRSRNLIVEWSVGRARHYARRIGEQAQTLAEKESKGSGEPLDLGEPELDKGINALLAAREERGLSEGEKRGIAAGGETRLRLIVGLFVLALCVVASLVWLRQSGSIADLAAESASSAAQQAIKGRTQTAEQVQDLLAKEAVQRQLELENVTRQISKANESVRTAQATYDAALGKVQTASARNARDAKIVLDRALVDLNFALSREKAINERLSQAQTALDQAQAGASAVKASRDALQQQLAALTNTKGDLQRDLDATKGALSSEQGQRELLTNQLRQSIEAVTACRGLVASAQDDVASVRTERDTMKASRDATQRQLDDCRRQLPGVAPAVPAAPPGPGAKP